jgi:hypothetical protein
MRTSGKGALSLTPHLEALSGVPTMVLRIVRNSS